jgi:tetratricopeptide (TPR) repeat protein
MPTPTPTPAAQEEKKDVKDEISGLKTEIATLKEQQYQSLVSRADATMTAASTVVVYTSFALAVFTVLITSLIGTAGFLGFKELKKIREIGTGAKKDIQSLIEDFRTQLDAQRQDLSQQIAEQSKILEAHRASVDAELQKQIVRVDDESKVLEGQLTELMKRFEQESQTFMEASYNFSMGERAYRENDFSGALMYFKKAEAFRPKDINILTRIARSNIELGDQEEAGEYFKKALEIEPTSPLVLRKAATLYRYTDLDRAIEYAKRATEIDCDDCEALDYLGLLYRDRGDFDGALAAHQQALTIRIRPETYFFLCLLYAHKRNFAKAKEFIAMGHAYLEKEASHPSGYQTRELWKKIVTFAEAVLDNQQDKAIEIAKQMSEYITTSRSQNAVRNHLLFLLNSLDESGNLTKTYFSYLGLQVPC